MTGIKVAMVSAALVGLGVCPVSAESPFNAKVSLRDNLASLQAGKKAVTVVLESGQTYNARVAEVGDHHIVLSAPQGKEFYDVMVPIEAIVAVETRARDQ